MKPFITALTLAAALGAGYAALAPAKKQELTCRYEPKEVESQFITFSYQSPMLQDKESKLLFRISIEQMRHDDECFDRLTGVPTFVHVCDLTETICRHYFDFEGDGVIERLADTNGPYTWHSQNFELGKDGRPEEPESYKELQFQNEGYLGFLDMVGQRRLVDRK